MYYRGEHLGTCSFSTRRVGSCCNLNTVQTKPPSQVNFPASNPGDRKVQTTSAAPPSRSGGSKRGTPNIGPNCKLQVGRSKRIVGGENVSDAEHPWAVNMWYNGTKGLREDVN